MNSIVTIGGGFFGLYLAYYFSTQKQKVELFEKDSELMSRASYNNQARIHNGYHYPRSVLTALRSRQSFPRFTRDFPQCVCNDFDKFYMIGKHLSKVTSYQFERFCKRIGAYLEPAPSRIVNLTNSNHIEACFKVKEFAFDSIKLKEEILDRIDSKYVKIHLNSEAMNIRSNAEKGLSVAVKNLKTTEISEYSAEHVFNCTYASINQILHSSSLELIPLKHEMTEMALVDVPEEIRHAGITVMCGPFFSVMPFPSVLMNGHYLHSFSHVRYTPHYEWYDKEDCYLDSDEKLKNDEKHSAWEIMRKDAARYIPCLDECIYRKSLWEVKTVLPRSEINDSRPILCKFNYGLKGFHCVMGGKIDNVYDAVAAINKEFKL